MFSIKLSQLLIVGVVTVGAIFFNQPNMIRVCLVSQAANFQSTCVLCAQNVYTNTMIACTQQTFLPQNTSRSQALCIINLCQSQVNQNVYQNQFQNPYYGRKKRSAVQNFGNSFKEIKTEFISIEEKEFQ